MYGVISLANGHATLFIPKYNEDYEVACGKRRPPNDFKMSYAVDEVHYVEDLASWLDSALKAESPNSKLHMMKGVNSDSGLSAMPATFAGDKAFWDGGKVSTDRLHFLLSTCRVTKSPGELDVMRYCAWVASNAHVEVMRTLHECEFEYELEAKFLYEIYRKGGCRKCAYTSICACGPNAAVLHYGHAGAPNDRNLEVSDLVWFFLYFCYVLIMLR